MSAANRRGSHALLTNVSEAKTRHFILLYHQRHRDDIICCVISARGGYEKSRKIFVSSAVLLPAFGILIHRNDHVTHRHHLLYE